MSKVLNCFIVADGLTNISDMATRKSVMTLYPGTKRLYFNTFTSADKQVWVYKKITNKLHYIYTLFHVQSIFIMLRNYNTAPTLQSLASVIANVIVRL